MAEALAKIKDNLVYPATTGDTDGSLLTPLLEALTAGAQLNVGQYGRTTHNPVNYTKGGDTSDIVDNHLAGIDTAFGGKASSTHKDTHKSGGGDALTSSDLLEAVVKRLQVTGPVTLTVGACADGKYLKRSGSTIIGDDPPGMSAHALGGSYHSIDTLANLNAKITGGSLDFNTAQRTAVIHNLGSNLRHGADTLANLNALISDANLDDSGDSRTPLTHGLGSHSTCILADLNSMVSDATLDTNTNPRPPTGSIVAGDLTGSYPSPGVGKIRGYAVQSGAPTTGDLLQWTGSLWEHVSGLIPHYDSGWFMMHYSTANNVLKTHNLGVLPRQVQVYVSSDSGSTCHLAGFFWLFSNQVNARGTIVTNITTTTLRVQCGTLSTGGMYDSYGTGGTRIQMSSGHARVLCWK